MLVEQTSYRLDIHINEERCTIRLDGRVSWQAVFHGGAFVIRDGKGRGGGGGGWEGPVVA